MDTDKELDEIRALPFKANGAGLSLSAVAASNIFSEAPVHNWQTAPAWIFFAGLIAAYFSYALVSQQKAHYGLVDAIRRLEKVSRECRAAENATERQLAIAAESERKANALKPKLLAEANLARLPQLMNWCNNVAMALFCIGVACGLVILGT